jgi:hypothetical protein
VRPMKIGLRYPQTSETGVLWFRFQGPKGNSGL